MKAPFVVRRRPVATPQLSPFEFVGGIAALQQAAQELVDLKDAHEAAHKKTLAKIEKDHAAVLNSLNDHVQKMYDYVATLKPEKAAPPIPGKDAPPVDEAVLAKRILAQIRPPKDGETPVIDHDLIAQKAAKLVKLPKIKNGDPGKDADPAKVVDLVIAKIQEEKLLTMDHIDGLTTEISSYRNQLAGKHYGETTMVRGGGDTVAAGSNVTIAVVNGVKTISASGGSLTELAATGTINSSNTTFTFTSKPTYIFIDGVKYRENEGWTWSVLTATVTKAPDYSIWGEK